MSATAEDVSCSVQKETPVPEQTVNSVPCDTLTKKGSHTRSGTQAKKRKSSGAREDSAPSSAPVPPVAETLLSNQKQGARPASLAGAAAKQVPSEQLAQLEERYQTQVQELWEGLAKTAQAAGQHQLHQQALLSLQQETLKGSQAGGMPSLPTTQLIMAPLPEGISESDTNSAGQASGSLSASGSADSEVSTPQQEAGKVRKLATRRLPAGARRAGNGGSAASPLPGAASTVEDSGNAARSLPGGAVLLGSQAAAAPAPLPSGQAVVQHAHDLPVYPVQQLLPINSKERWDDTIFYCLSDIVHAALLILPGNEGKLQEIYQAIASIRPARLITTFETGKQQTSQSGGTNLSPMHTQIFVTRTDNWQANIRTTLIRRKNKFLRVTGKYATYRLNEKDTLCPPAVIGRAHGVDGQDLAPPPTVDEKPLLAPPPVKALLDGAARRSFGRHRPAQPSRSVHEIPMPGGDNYLLDSVLFMSADSSPLDSAGGARGNDSAGAGPSVAMDVDPTEQGMLQYTNAANDLLARVDGGMTLAARSPSPAAPASVSTIPSVLPIPLEELDTKPCLTDTSPAGSAVGEEMKTNEQMEEWSRIRNEVHQILSQAPLTSVPEPVSAMPSVSAAMPSVSAALLASSEQPEAPIKEEDPADRLPDFVSRVTWAHILGGGMLSALLQDYQGESDPLHLASRRLLWNSQDCNMFPTAGAPGMLPRSMDLDQMDVLRSMFSLIAVILAVMLLVSQDYRPGKSDPLYYSVLQPWKSERHLDMRALRVVSCIGLSCVGCAVLIAAVFMATVMCLVVLVSLFVGMYSHISASLGLYRFALPMQTLAVAAVCKICSGFLTRTMHKSKVLTLIGFAMAGVRISLKAAWPMHDLFVGGSMLALTLIVHMSMCRSHCSVCERLDRIKCTLTLLWINSICATVWTIMYGAGVCQMPVTDRVLLGLMEFSLCALLPHMLLRAMHNTDIGAKHRCPSFSELKRSGWWQTAWLFEFWDSSLPTYWMIHSICRPRMEKVLQGRHYRKTCNNLSSRDLTHSLLSHF